MGKFSEGPFIENFNLLRDCCCPKEPVESNCEIADQLEIFSSQFDRHMSHVYSSMAE